MNVFIGRISTSQAQEALFQHLVIVFLLEVLWTAPEVAGYL